VEDVFRLAVLLRPLLLLGLLVFVCFLSPFFFSFFSFGDDELGLIFLFSFPGGLKHWLDGIGW
jgi:hypothetical protein